MNNSRVELQNLIDGFRFTCETEGKSPKTIEWYTSFLCRFLWFLESRGFPTAVGQINKDTIRAFIRYLQVEARTPRGSRPLSAATIQGYVRTLKAFSSWAAREDYIYSNPMTKIAIPKSATKLINTFNHGQITKLPDACSRADGSGYRNLVILLLLLDSGLRVSELVNINLDDVDLTEGYIKIKRAKGSKERLVPTSACPSILLTTSNLALFLNSSVV